MAKNKGYMISKTDILLPFSILNAKQINGLNACRCDLTFSFNFFYKNESY